MAAATPRLNGTVYQYRSKNNWKETWLCLEENGTLIWKRKDAYQVKGTAYLDQIIGGITIGGCSRANSKLENGNGNATITPFVLHIPISTRGSSGKKQKLAVKSSQDLNAWLDAFATITGKWKLWKACKRNEERKISASTTDYDDRNVLNVLNYQELVEFYSASWKEFLQRLGRNEDVDEDEGSGLIAFGPGDSQAQHNGHQQQHYKKHKRNNSDGGGTNKQIGSPTSSTNANGTTFENDEQKLHVAPNSGSRRGSDAYLETIPEDIHF